MKLSWQFILTVVILLGICGSAQGAVKGKKVYRLEACDCVGVYEKDMTFLSDILGEPNIEVEASSRAKAQAEADKQCFDSFRGANPEVKEGEVSSTGCTAFEKVANLDDWQAI